MMNHGTMTRRETDIRTGMESVVDAEREAVLNTSGVESKKN